MMRSDHNIPDELSQEPSILNKQDASIDTYDSSSEQCVSPQTDDNDTIVELGHIEKQVHQKKPVSTSVHTDNENEDDEDDYKVSNTKSAAAVADNNTKVNSDILKKLDVDLQLQIQNKIKSTLLCNVYFWTRICSLFLILLLILLSISYAFGAVTNIELNLIKECTERSIQEIWEHSLEIDSTLGTSDGCWTTSNSPKVDLDGVLTNSYHCHSHFDAFSIFKCVLFLMLSFCCICLLIYGLTSVIMDCKAIRNQTLYTKSSKFANYVNNTQLNGLFRFKKGIERMFGMETMGNIVIMMITECLEILIQSIALVFYNGFNIFDSNGIYLAHQYQFVLLFSCILSFNCILTGILWLLFVFKHDKCNGLIFKICAFCVDQCGDLMYIIYPFIVIFNRTDFSNICVIFGLLNNKSIASFVFRVFPMILLCIKCFSVMRSSICAMRDKSYDSWFMIQKVISQSTDKDAVYIANILGYVIDGKYTLNKEIYDQNGNLKLKVSSTNANSFYTQQNTITGSKRFRFCIIMMSITFLIYAVLIMSLVTVHILQSRNYCVNAVADNNILKVHPEFTVYHLCQVPVYPFTFSNDTADQCECRSIQIDFTLLNISHLNITFQRVLDAVFTQWRMLEKIDIQYHGVSEEHYQLKADDFKATEMKIFRWEGIVMDGIDDQISNWNQLQYFALSSSIFSASASHPSSLPTTFASLRDLQVVEFRSSGLDIDLHMLCNLTKLNRIVIRSGHDTGNIVIPLCFTKLDELQQLWIQQDTLKSFPLELVTLPNLVELDLWENDISLESIREYNNMESYQSVFDYLINNTNPDLNIYIIDNPLCLETVLSEVQQILNLDKCFLDDCVDIMSLNCPPLEYGNGFCNEGCDQCNHDGGDCTQFCFTKTSCTYTKFLNTECDDECNYGECNWDNGYCEETHPTGTLLPPPDPPPEPDP